MYVSLPVTFMATFSEHFDEKEIKTDETSCSTSAQCWSLDDVSV